MKSIRAALPLFLLALLSPKPAPAADDDWVLIVKDRERHVELDRSTVIQSDSGTKVAWARIVLTPARAAAEGYASVKALNRFDCTRRSFDTVKRVYLDARGLVLREEAVRDRAPVVVGRNGVDARLWQEVCRPPSSGELQALARDAVASAAAVIDAGPIEAAPGRTGDPAESAAVGNEHRRAAAPAPAAGLVLVAAKAPASAANREPPAPVERARPARNEVTRTAVAAPGPVPRTPGAAGAPPAPDWGYDGATGPEHWGRMRPDWALCADGRRQSPIDLRDGIAVDLEPLAFDYRATRFRIADTGRTLRIDVGEGLGVEIRGRRYELEHLEFLRPSAGRVGGQASAMEAHLHHRAADGALAVVAVMLERGDAPHPLVQTVWNNLPLDRGTDYAPAAATIDPAALLPAERGHFLYAGSLVTPPCTEGVTWAVMKAPATLSDEQLAIFARLYPRNSRPIQPRNGRLVLESR